MDDRHSFLVRHFGLRGIALFEAAKGLLSLALGILLLSVRHKDMERIAGHVLGAMHINPDRRFYHEVLHAAGRVTPHGIWLFVFGVIAYAAIRFAEATGLWLEREWAEWFALISGSLYLPWEIFELARRQTWIRWAILGINILIVLYLLWLRIEMHKMRKRAKLQAPATATPDLGT
jgi:uncharacterized membrane protein (DUF2068 family)